ncbi:alanine or glycine:cation symporter, AGCS family [Cytobacillus horneckiae]|uniref:Alanine:cation symporter family protein n=1 Tax=Cytobacillus horneckiae TaxID=549687 RepID=A0A2N0ZHJ8_9BACI|nr:alanine/glycine:cation symporter family protein [Cytobacillus horneckiae]MBN6887730.1 alanine:cation symporter family protein [Cytobacillus horneckiae]MCM3181199.1 alanine:cation symporter family protein [Cytobacillus horneckiae]MEC1158264.1 alanine/glycine:cation symporter family protein [Cytobacillus horneckiae]MED2940092.1 alanine/glycine:cation symporter family protein [Cytobacillus horneckiae]PKG28982.1 alanine:cation symporter family protein [Cytobacillus horneckiae]
MEMLETVISTLNNALWSYILIILLIGMGLYFTFRTKFVQFRMVKEMFKLLGEGATADKKGVSSFQAFCISTASRVGTGNLAGVAIAITTGGPGAVFWMWLIALIGSASAFVETTLAQIYKVKDGDAFRGGPAYYMEKALNARWMGITFAVLISLTFGLAFNSVQANTITSALHESFGISKWVMALILAVVTAVIIFGGIKTIAKVSEVIVPIMAGAYVLVALVVIIMNIKELPSIFALIFESAFGISEVAGGALGAAMMNGIKRGLFSNEAGMGSAPNAGATADVSHPVKQGLIQSLGVFVDTLVICSSTAFIILFSGLYTSKESDGIVLTQNALGTSLGSWAGIFLAIIVLLFAFSSILGNYYYGESNIGFINENKIWLHIYRGAVVGMVVFGSLASLQFVWNLADLLMGLMAIINLIAIALLGKIAFAALADYQKQKKSGKDPVFHVNNIKGLKNVECWGDQADQAVKNEDR